MLLTPTIQLTIYLYWANYQEFKEIQKAVLFSQLIYVKPHRYIFQMLAKYLRTPVIDKQVREK